MKPDEKLIAFCEGYLSGLLACNADLYDWDDWVLWDAYDINFNGPYLDEGAPDEHSLVCDVYPAGWEGDLPPTLHRFVVKGESK